MNLSFVVLSHLSWSHCYIEKHSLLRSTWNLCSSQVLLRLCLRSWKFLVSFDFWIFNASKLVNVFHERIQVYPLIFNEFCFVFSYFLAQIQHSEILFRHGIKRKVVCIWYLFQMSVFTFLKAHNLIHSF